MECVERVCGSTCAVDSAEHRADGIYALIHLSNAGKGRVLGQVEGELVGELEGDELTSFMH